MLYIVGTPIGNLKEFNNYAIEILNTCDYILCEDTRESMKLLNFYDIKKTLKSYHKFNEKERIPSIITDLKDNKNIALICDAGMPCISDPGNVLVNEVINHNLEYTVISGPAALINAFVLSGYQTPFCFIGFLPEKQVERKELVIQFKSIKCSLIFYLAKHNIEKDFKFLYEILGDKPACVVREISKVFEEKTFTTLNKGYIGVNKGEFVLVVNNFIQENRLNSLNIKQHLLHYINLGFSKQDAINFVRKDRNISKSEVYKYSIDL